MAGEYNQTIEHLEHSAKYARRSRFLYATLIFYGVGLTAIDTLFAWAHDWKLTDFFAMSVGVVIATYGGIEHRKWWRKYRLVADCLANFKAANTTLSYTAKEHHVNQGLAALNQVIPGINDQMIRSGIEGAADQGG